MGDTGIEGALPTDAEQRRLGEAARREKDWKRWGPYLAERQWGTVREDYSPWGTCWDYFTHDHARSRAYRWGEDGLLGISDHQSRMCFALALWNGADPILKERLFGLTGPEGNHGEDVKEQYFYVDSTPTHSYMKALYKYPQSAYPYSWLVEENRRRGKHDPEFELLDTKVFDGSRYFDVFAEYAKSSPNDVLIQITVANRGPEAATLHLLPTLWFRNTWSWGRTGEGYWPRPHLSRQGDGTVLADHESLGRFRLAIDDPSVPLLFTENETNMERLFGAANAQPHVKDAFDAYVVHGRLDAVNPSQIGTKMAAHYVLQVPAGGERVVRLRLFAEGEAPTDHPFGPSFDRVFADRMADADAFYDGRIAPLATPAERHVIRQAYAGLLWSKQFYKYDVRTWLEGDPSQPPPPPERKRGRNADWTHLYNRDVVSMPDKWEYPWYAAWDLAFHMLPFAHLDPDFAKAQLVLFLREWYMHPNGQIPAYEFAFGDVNPPVHAWAAWRTYKIAADRGQRDRIFLSRVFQKLCLNFTWWVNRKDVEGNNLFGGGFLGLDNIGVFDRSRPLPGNAFLEQADGTAWMAFYAITLMAMSLELSKDNPATEDMASKFFEHFVAIADAMNELGGSGLWCDVDGFYYDQLSIDGQVQPLRVRSLVGFIPLLAVSVLDEDTMGNLPGFTKRLNWFLENRTDLARQISCMTGKPGHQRRLLAIPSRERLERMLRYLLDENEFLSPHGIRSVSKFHEQHPFILRTDGVEHRVTYVPGESDTGMFGGNSNWRGPVWFPINYLIIEALERYHHFFGDDLKVELPTGSGRMATLKEAADEISRRLTTLFVPDEHGRRACNGDDARWVDDPHWKDLVLFYEFFHGDTGRGMGANHQTGWTSLVVRSLQDMATARETTTVVDRTAALG